MIDYVLLLLAHTALPHAEVRCPAALGGHRFVGAAMYDGPIGVRRSALAPERERRASFERQSWLLPSGGQGVWVECRYDRTPQTLSLTLREENLECSMMLEFDAQGRVIQAAPLACS